MVSDIYAKQFVPYRSWSYATSIHLILMDMGRNQWALLCVVSVSRGATQSTLTLKAPHPITRTPPHTHVLIPIPAPPSPSLNHPLPSLRMVLLRHAPSSRIPTPT